MVLFISPTFRLSNHQILKTRNGHQVEKLAEGLNVDISEIKRSRQ